MDVSWPPRLGLGDRVRFEDRAWVVAGFAGGSVQLADPLGDMVSPTVAELVLSTDFEVVERGSRVPSVGVLPASDEVFAKARWWERHITEVISGLPSGSAPDAVPRAEYDPARRSLSEREAAKAAELTAAGVPGASARTVRRRRQRYQAQGIDGLVDGRAVRKRTPGAHQDPRVLEMLLTLMSDDTRRGHTASADEYRRFVGRMLDTLYGSDTVPLPSRSTFQRLVKAVRAQHGGSHGVTVIDGQGIRLSRPGERVHVDTFRLALPAHLARPSLRSVQITVAFDELTLMICTLIVHTSSHDVDGPTLLARLCGPPAARTTVPGSDEEREVMPLIMPESLVLDGLRMRRGRAFLDECRAMGIRIEARRPATKAAGEHITRRLAALFGAELTTLRRQPAHDDTSLITRLQDLAERWAESIWRHQPQAGLQAVGGHRQATPASAYEACVARLGWVHMPLGGHAVRHLLPSVTRRVTDRGVVVKQRRYFHARLASLQSTGSVEVRFDPYDLHQVWVRMSAETWLQVALTKNAQGQLSSWDIWMSAGATRRVQPDVSARGPALALDSIQERLSYHAQLPVLRTPFLQEVLRLGDRLAVLNRRPAGGRQGLLITGPPRSGKTTALQELSRHVSRMSVGSFPCGPAVYLRLHPADSARAALLRLGKLVGLPPLPHRTSTAAVSEAVQEALIASETSLVLVDDAFPETSMARSSPVETLRFLADQVPALFVYADEDREGSPFTPERGAGQGRLAHVRAAPVPHGAGWEHLVETLDRALRLRHHQPGSLLRLAPVLHDRTGGWAGGLAHLVRSASIDAILSGREEITDRDFDSVTV